MRLATLRAEAGLRTVALVEESTLVHVADGDLGQFLQERDWRARAAEAIARAEGVVVLAEAELACLVPHPSKVVCVGLNYRNHITEMGRELPSHPTVFAKFWDSLVGPYDPIALPPETERLDWEVELTLVIGQPVRRADAAQAAAAIAGFTVMNDITCRDWQFRTREWLQGKTWDSTTPVGPFLVTPDELPGGVRPELRVSLDVDGEVRQSDSTADLLFDPVDLVQYVSTIVRLNPGDLIATGTPGGVGNAREPGVFLRAGQTVTAEIEQIGRLVNTVVSESVSR